MPIETLPNSPHPRVEDNPETSFTVALGNAVDTLFTYRGIADSLKTRQHDEIFTQFVHQWKQGLVRHLEMTAAGAAAVFLEDFEQVQSGHPVILWKKEEETPAGSQFITDPYRAALSVYQARVDRMKERGELLRVSQITDEEALDDHFDALASVYRQTCLEMGLSWPPLPRDMKDSQKE